MERIGNSHRFMEVAQKWRHHKIKMYFLCFKIGEKIRRFLDQSSPWNHLSPLALSPTHHPRRTLASCFLQCFIMKWGRRTLASCFLQCFITKWGRRTLASCFLQCFIVKWGEQKLIIYTSSSQNPTESSRTSQKEETSFLYMLFNP